jgi:hypothetical protein
MPAEVFGDAAFLGDMSATRLAGPVLDSIATPTGRGYHMVAEDGGIFNFSDGIHRIPGRHPSGDAHHVCGPPRRALSRSAEPLLNIDGAPAS